MSEVNAPYATGTPCWVDLMAKDHVAAIDFYKDLFGWSGEPGPAEFGGYAVLELKGRPVCGIGPAMAQEGAPPPPHVWTTYLASDDADVTAGKVTAAGGSLLFPAMDVGELGRMFVASDPTGAVFGVWGHKSFYGATIVNEPGALTWNECNTRDVPKARAFYESALGLTSQAMEGAGGYFTLEAAGRTVGGLQDMGAQFPAEVPAHWMTWFAVESRDETVDALVKAGGNVVAPPMEIPQGKMAGLQDPWGAVFCVLEAPETAG